MPITQQNGLRTLIQQELKELDLKWSQPGFCVTDGEDMKLLLLEHIRFHAEQNDGKSCEDCENREGEIQSLRQQLDDVLNAEPKMRTIAGSNAVTVFDECAKLLDSKQLDYGPDNIRDGGMAGVTVRMADKLARLKTLTKPGVVTTPIHESVEDTLLDLANYANIGLQLWRDIWPLTESALERKE